MASENSPLLAYRLLGDEGVAFSANGAGGPGGASARKLSTFLGVVVPTVLSMFSIVVFLRIGEWGGGASSGVQWDGEGSDWDGVREGSWEKWVDEELGERAPVALCLALPCR